MQVEYCGRNAGRDHGSKESEGVEATVKELTEFLACRCFAFKNQSQTVRGY